MNEKSTQIAEMAFKPWVALPTYVGGFSLAHFSADSVAAWAGAIGLVILAIGHAVTVYIRIIEAKRAREALKKERQA